MPSQGIIVNDAAVTGIQTTYTSCLLHEDEVSDARSVNGSLPSACLWGDLELVFDVTAGACTDIDVVLTWDSAGDDVAVGEMQLSTSDGSLVAGMNDTSRLMASVPLNAFKRATDQQTTAGKLYLWAQIADALGGTISILTAKLQWTVPAYGGR